jgi:OPT family small oligopeptide transporter
MLITIMANVGFSTPYTDNIIWSQYLPQYYNQRYAGQFSYQILIGLGTNFVGYGMAGLTRRFLVYPSYAVWPTSLVTIALNSALHSTAEDVPVKTPFGRTIRASRMKVFLYSFIGMFLYFFFPNYIFTALSAFNWLSWIAPTNKVYNSIVGFNYGLGLNPWSTFDWNIVTFMGDPLVLPSFNILNGAAGTFLTMFMILGLYYTNTWNTSYLPINSNRTFDRFGKYYNISRAIDERGHFSKDEYEAYSQAHMAAGNITVYFWFFAVYSGVVSYAWLYHRHEIAMGFKNLFRRGKRVELYSDVHNKLMQAYPEVSEWWYFGVLCFAITCGCCGIGLWETYTTPAVVIYGIILCAVAVVPVGIIASITGLQVTLNVIAEFIGGAWVAGNALAMNYFKSFGYVTCAHALAFSSDLKLAHYVKLPPRHTFAAQLGATLISTFVCTGVLNFQMNSIRDVCTPDAAMKMTCPGINTFFTGKYR